MTASGGEGTTKTRHALGPDAGTVQISYDMFAIPDRLDCFYKGVPQPGGPTWCLVVMSAPNSGTAWVYTLNCPS